MEPIEKINDILNNSELTEDDHRYPVAELHREISTFKGMHAPSPDELLEENLRTRIFNFLVKAAKQGQETKTAIAALHVILDIITHKRGIRGDIKTFAFDIAEHLANIDKEEGVKALTKILLTAGSLSVEFEYSTAKTVPPKAIKQHIVKSCFDEDGEGKITLNREKANKLLDFKPVTMKVKIRHGLLEMDEPKLP